MTGSRRLPCLTTAALLTAALTAAPALGQNRVQGGNAHDANQQVGSGGYNQPSNQVDYRARNLIITGQVGGGRSFQGQIDYTAAGSFQGNLGSDSLFNFRRDSVFSAPGAANFRTRQLGDRVIVTRSTTSIPGLAGGSGFALSTRSQYDPSSGTLSFRQAGGGLVAITGINNTDQLRDTAGTSLGLVRTPGGIVSIDASPLTGIRYNPLDASTGFNDLSPQNNRDQRPQAEDDPTNPLDIAPERTLDGTPDPGAEDEDTSLFNLPEDPLTVTLGMQVQSALMLQLADRQDNNIPNAQAELIRNQLFTQNQQQPGEPGEPPKAPENPYDKIIADILAQAEGATPDEQPDEAEPAEDNRPRWQQILEEPDQAVLDAKQKARDAALRISLGMVDDMGNIDYETELPQIDPDSELGKLLADLDYEIPRVNTLAGTDENRINTLMARGEQELKAGRYTVSESVYRQVLRETQGDPLAKAGLIHSQMGAGMIRSAAFNLRGLFSDHPELIALQYETNLLPETERLRWLQSRLQKQIADDNPGSEPGLILAYLGYQLEAPPLIEFGLTVAEAEAPRDPLMPVLRSIWLEGEDAGE